MRVGLVLGAGGVLGAAWEIGALHALVDETGWEPQSASLVVGTSCGAIVGGLVASGARPWTAYREERAAFLGDLLDAASYRFQLPPALLPPGSWTLALAGWREGPRAGLAKMLAGIVPQGFLSTEPIRRLIHRYGPDRWPRRPRLWIPATDYGSGERVVFGRRGAPEATVAVAIAASCAIPGFYRPVDVGGRPHVDGGLASGANLDLLASRRLDLVICLSPLSSPTTSLVSPARALRARLHEQVVRDVERLRARRIPVLLLEPVGAAVDLIGLNPMNRRRGPVVARAADASVREQLGTSELGLLLERLAGGPASRGPSTPVVEAPGA